MVTAGPQSLGLYVEVCVCAFMCMCVYACMYVCACVCADSSCSM